MPRTKHQHWKGKRPSAWAQTRRWEPQWSTSQMVADIWEITSQFYWKTRSFRTVYIYMYTYIYIYTQKINDVDGISFYPHYPSSIFDHVFSTAFPAPFLPSLPRGHSTCDPRWRRRSRWERPGQSTHKSACTRRRKTPGLQCNPWWILDAVKPGFILNPKRLFEFGGYNLSIKYIETPVFFTGRSTGVTNWSLPDAHGHSKIEVLTGGIIYW